uniref:Uncharacterized protein n=1 Tax=Bubo bubo TaxID=30461 RepID=A0A8C0IE30_BUBBB
ASCETFRGCCIQMDAGAQLWGIAAALRNQCPCTTLPSTTGLQGLQTAWGEDWPILPLSGNRDKEQDIGEEHYFHSGFASREIGSFQLHLSAEKELTPTTSPCNMAQIEERKQHLSSSVVPHLGKDQIHSALPKGIFKSSAPISWRQL